jgi:FolB domain-containing protein
MKVADTLRVTGIAVDCILGELPVERTKAQRIVVDIEIAFDATPAALSADLARTIDYARLEKELRFILTESHFRLVESAALALAQWLLLPPLGTEPSATKARVTLAKPAALPGGAIPSVVVERTVAGSTVRAGAAPGDKEVTAFLCPDAGVYRLHGSAGVWPRPTGYGAMAQASFAPGVTARVARK